MLASDASAAGHGSPVQFISRGLFVSTSPVNGQVLRHGKFVAINYYQQWLISRKAEILNINAPHRFCKLSN
jgi:hypothetical protein